MQSSPASAFYSGSTETEFRETAAPHVPVLTLDQEGTIQSLTEAARRALEYSGESDPDPCFFAHVHARNQHRVMRDLADMVCRGKQRAQWLLRLRTGNKRWRWYRATVRNELRQEEGYIHVRLRPL